MGKTPPGPTAEDTPTAAGTPAREGTATPAPTEPQDAGGAQAPPLPDLTPQLLQSLGAEIALEFPTPIDETSLVLMDVDPHRVHAFWHVCAPGLEAARRRLDRPGGAAMVLRMRDVTPSADGAEPWEPFEIEVQGRDSHCYVDLWQDGRVYEAELGLRGRDGTLVPLAHSNRIATPPATPPGPEPAPAGDRAEPHGPDAGVAEARRRAARTGAEDAGPAAGEPGGGAEPVQPWGVGGAAPTNRSAVLASGDARVLLEGYFGPPPAALGEEYGAVALSGEGAPVAVGDAAAWAGAGVGPGEPALQAPDIAALTPEFPNPAPGAPDETAPTDGVVPVAETAGAWLPPIGLPAEGGGSGEERAAQAGEERTGQAGAAEVASGGPPLLSLSSSALARAPGLLEVHAEVHVFGWARPGSRLRVFGRPVALRPDGSFSVRRPLPEGALILPLELLPPAEDSEAGPD